MKRRNINLQRKKLHRRICAGVTVLAAVLVIGMSTPVLATEYSVEITPEMQMNGIEEADTGDGTATENSDRVMITDSILYDKQQEIYMYGVSGSYIYANVLDGMMTQNGVKITSDSGVDFSVYKDGDAIKLPENQTVTDVGSYSVMSTQSGNETEVFSFIIIGSAMREPQYYSLPSACVLTLASRNGEELTSTGGSIDLSEEGDYHIEYLCARNNVAYTLDFDVDHTAPTLEFEGLEDNKARGKVTILDYEKGANLTIIKDGSEISSRTELTQPGSYTVRIADDAGNASVYSFYILFYLNAGGITFGILAVAVIVALVVYLYIARKRMRVR